MALADFQQIVADLMSDQEADALTLAVRDRAIETARVRYSADCERVLVEDVTWLAAGFEGPLPPGWVAGAALRQAECPIGQQPPQLIDLAVYLSPAGQSLLAARPLPEGSVVRVTYAAPHLLQAGAQADDTIPLAHREAVAYYAAYVLCQQLATRYSAERETAVGADVSLTETRARAYAARAREYRTAYYLGTGQVDPFAKQSGTASSGAVPAAAVGSWPKRHPRYDLTRWNRGKL